MNKVISPILLFYQKLGELFYAVAASDKIVRQAEYKALTQVVVEEWTSMDDYDVQFKSDAAYQISIIFEWFDYERMDANECFESFSHYYNDHKELFSEKRKILILKTAKKIAGAFAENNKNELVIITKLYLLFKNN